MRYEFKSIVTKCDKILFRMLLNPVSMGISTRSLQTSAEEVCRLILFYGRRGLNVLILNHQSTGGKGEATKRSYWSSETRILTLQQLIVSLVENVCVFLHLFPEFIDHQLLNDRHKPFQKNWIHQMLIILWIS